MSTLGEFVILNEWKPLSYYVGEVVADMIYSIQNNSEGVVVLFDGEQIPTTNSGIHLNPNCNLEYCKGIGTLYLKSLFENYSALLTISNNQ